MTYAIQILEHEEIQLNKILLKWPKDSQFKQKHELVKMRHKDILNALERLKQSEPKQVATLVNQMNIFDGGA